MIQVLKSYWMSISITVANILFSVIKLPMVTCGVKVISLGLDKWIHSACYAAFTLVLLWELGKNMQKTKAVVLAATISFSIGVLMELLQHLLDYRTANPYDIVANILGVCLSLLLYYLYQYLRKQT